MLVLVFVLLLDDVEFVVFDDVDGVLELLILVLLVSDEGEDSRRYFFNALIKRLMNQLPNQ